MRSVQISCIVRGKKIQFCARVVAAWLDSMASANVCACCACAFWFVYNIIHRKWVWGWQINRDRLGCSSHCVDGRSELMTNRSIRTRVKIVFADLCGKSGWSAALKRNNSSV